MKSRTILILAALVLSSAAARAQSTGEAALNNRVNLEDVSIQGEANKNGAQFLNRSRFGLDDRVKIRKDFRPELEENVPDSFKGLPEKLLND